MQPPQPVMVLDLFPIERAALLDLLSVLNAEQWQAPTVCEGWSVKDIAAHIVGDDLGRLSRQRDGFLATAPAPGESLVAFINRINGEWVQAMRRLSPRLICELLRNSGDATQALFASLDPYVLGGAVNWAGPDPAPVWLDLAREYTERWHHQAHIRDALGVAPLTEPRLFAPVLATFVRALPHTFRDVEGAEGTTIQVQIAGESGGDWSLVRTNRGWSLYSGAPIDAAARVALDQALAWRLFTKGVSRVEAESAARIDGDSHLGRHVLQAVAIIA